MKTNHRKEQFLFIIYCNRQAALFAVRVISTHLTLTYRVHKNMYSLLQHVVRLLFYLYRLLVFRLTLIPLSKA